VQWSTGETVRITVDDIPGTPDRVSTTYTGLAADAKPGDRLLVDDGKVALQVVDIEGTDIVCTVTVGGAVSDNKGLSLPGVNVSVPATSSSPSASGSTSSRSRSSAPHATFTSSTRSWIGSVAASPCSPNWRSRRP
jgi:Pyruvate kinase, barrel domain